MDVLQKLGLALGFATLAGLNLYLTVFATSLALCNGWISLSPEYGSLQVLGHPAVAVVSGVLFVVEFFADKVPWLDSLWDLIHTAIRPLGGAFLALKTLGNPDPAFDVIAALLAGGVTLTVHGAKAGTRLVANGSPEPFTNVALSVVEDVGVVGGLGLLNYSYHHNPWIALIVFGVILLALLYITPKVFRFLRVKLWLFWRKMAAPVASQAATPGQVLPAEPDMLFTRLNPQGEEIAWAVPCLTGSGRRSGLPTGFSGWLVGTRQSPGKMHFVGQRGWRSLTRTVDIDGCKVSQEPRFLSEDLVVYHPDRGTKHVFVFDRSRVALVGSLLALLRGEKGMEIEETPGQPVPARGVRVLSTA